ncbi:glycosyltransferase [Flavobacterium sp. DGU11]|uniref:Glycosyltransferase n=1 Tax=Flavobacterium arundinis TaxID=3139143 RepID=A0ABU9HTR2_9FLAO
MIRLVTISRISREKGFERMLQVEKLLLASGIPFTWDCFGNTSTAYARQVIPLFQTIKFRGVTHEPLEVVKRYDYLIQLSDTEGFPYSVYEAMQQKVPVIATDFPSIHEMIIDGENGYILNMDLSNFDSNKLQSVPVIDSFTEKSTEKDWLNFLNMANKKAVPVKAKKSIVTIKVARRYHDTLLGKVLEAGHEFKVTPGRATVLEQAKVATTI